MYREWWFIAIIVVLGIVLLTNLWDTFGKNKRQKIQVVNVVQSVKGNNSNNNKNAKNTGASAATPQPRAIVNNNNLLKQYILKETTITQPFQVIGDFSTAGNYTATIIIDNGKNGISSGKLLILPIVKVLHYADLDDFRSISINVTADLPNEIHGDIIRSTFTAASLNSPKALEQRNGTIKTYAEKWWEIS